MSRNDLLDEAVRGQLRRNYLNSTETLSENISRWLAGGMTVYERETIVEVFRIISTYRPD